MEFTTDYKDRSGDIIAMFHQTFTASEGFQSGQIIKELVADMLGSLGDPDMHVFSVVEDGAILASILFTRLRFDQDARTVFLLAPVAVATAHQAKGIGQELIAHGLENLRESGVDVVLTYGDINFYAKVGFSHITEAEARAPLPLQYPEGWLGQSLAGAQFVPLVGPSRCVAPLNNPAHW